MAPVATPVVLQTGANTIYINGTVHHKGNGTGIQKDTAEPTCKLVILDLKVLTQGGISINDVFGGGIRVIHSLAADSDSSPTMGLINSITGSVAYFDANVI